MLGIFYIRSMSKMSEKKLGFGLMRLLSLDPNAVSKYVKPRSMNVF